MWISIAPKLRTPVYSVFCDGAKTAGLGAKSNFSAGIAFAAPISSFSKAVSISSKLFAGATVVPAAIFCAAPICALAAVTQQPINAARNIRPAIDRIVIIISLNSCKEMPPAYQTAALCTLYRKVMRRIYMDANATTPLLPEVFDAMRPFWIEHFGNASSIHQQGQHARAAVDHARESVAALLRCRSSEVVFTSGGTESDNLALFGVLQPFIASGGPAHLITTSSEHHAVLHAAEALRGRGIEVTFLGCTPQGLIEPEALRAALRPNTKLVSVMLANNETGVIQPIAELAAIAHGNGALFHTDAVQAAGKLPLDLSKSGELKHVDLLSISGHKMYAPQGTGVLFCRRNVRLAPLFFGGSHERQRRPGTENVAGIVALGRAAELASSWLSANPGKEAGAPSIAPLAHAMGGAAGAPCLDSETWVPDAPPNSPEALAALRDRLETGILNSVEESGVNGAGLPRVLNTTNLYFDHVEAEALVIALDLKGLSVSGGSACQSGATEPSHVLTAMGLSPARARSSVRFSLSRLTTAEEIDRALEIIPAAVARLRTLSPTWRKPDETLASKHDEVFAS